MPWFCFLPRAPTPLPFKADAFHALLMGLEASTEDADDGQIKATARHFRLTGTEGK